MLVVRGAPGRRQTLKGSATLNRVRYQPLFVVLSRVGESVATVLYQDSVAGIQVGHVVDQTLISTPLPFSAEWVLEDVVLCDGRICMLLRSLETVALTVHRRSATILAFPTETAPVAWRDIVGLGRVADEAPRELLQPTRLGQEVGDVRVAL